jgi:hypothetical protein
MRKRVRKEEKKGERERLMFGPKAYSNASGNLKKCGRLRFSQFDKSYGSAAASLL